MRAQKAHRQAEEVARDAETKVEAAKAAAANEIQETLAANQVAMLEFERKTRTEADDRIAVAEGRARDAETKADNAAAEAKRAEEGRSAAEEHLQKMRNFVEEAKVVDRRNAVMDTDLSREIQRAQRLHNQLEDMKGKIRVYVRVRPMSKKEETRLCEVACIKDSKSALTVLQPEKKAPDDKRHFDFDAVYAGLDHEGNRYRDWTILLGYARLRKFSPPFLNVIRDVAPYRVWNFLSNARTSNSIDMFCNPRELTPQPPPTAKKISSPTCNGSY